MKYALCDGHCNCVVLPIAFMSSLLRVNQLRNIESDVVSINMLFSDNAMILDGFYGYYVVLEYFEQELNILEPNKSDFDNDWHSDN